MSLTEATKPAKQDSRKAKAATAAPPREQILIGPDFIQKGEPHERLDRLFADLASRFDAAPAVISGGRRWSYRELNSRANQFAHLLIERGVKPGDRIGLLLDRSAETYIAVLAVMKAGAAFVPLATAFPEDRMVMIIEDANVTMVISVSGYAARVARLPVPHISIDSAESEIALQPETAPLPEGAQDQPTLILVYEPEKACLDRLSADGYPADRALEISSYLAQSTDLAPEFDLLAAACEKRGLAFKPVELDDAVPVLAKADPATTLVWTLTDGIAYFRGGASPALARLNGLRTIGADDSLFALCQDKFRCGAVLGALGLPVPQAGLARNGEWLVEPPASPKGWFVKPKRLGAKIGIWPDSRITDLGHALELSRRVFSHYRDDVVVQPYVAGRNVRASFLGLKPETGIEALGIFFVDSGGDFQTMADSMALYGETGQAAKDAGTYVEPELEAVGASQPAADRKIRAIAQKLISGLGLRDVFSVDLRVDADDTVHLIEFEVCPGLPCFDFRDYCRREWGMSLADAMAETAANRLFR